MAENPAQLDNVTDILKTILEGYDIRLRPNFGGNVFMFNIYKCVTTIQNH